MDGSNFIKNINIKHLLKAEIITNTSFLSLNIIIIILLFFILRSTLKKIIILKYRLMILCIIEVVLRIIYIKYYFVEKKLLKEILLSIVNGCQIYLIINLIESILTDIDLIINNQNNLNGQNEHINHNKDKISIYFCIAFLIINLPYERFPSFKIFICLLQNISLLFYSLVLYKYVNKKIVVKIDKLIDGNLIKGNDFIIRLLDVQLPILILYLFIFLIDIFSGYLGDSIIALYSKLVKISIKESSKFLIFIVLYSMIYLLEKINLKKIAISNSSISMETKKLMNEQ